ncbi:ATP-binding cassette domain-containing protein [Bacillus sp. NPDC093026]|uniref:ATP-binding cassette domain-containing protein n=1 Tax=Bacillus sp. NPDC093026 TaxID=3363948 RepID=UPI003830F33B
MCKGFRWKGGKRILWKQVNGEVRGGDKVVIIGKNGSGKTTLLKVLVNSHPCISRSEAVNISFWVFSLINRFYTRHLIKPFGMRPSFALF